ncbi:hypothetical protein [Alteriqipengyuania lutimaris]|uniref:Uncharacterized protein n=1 Tax=Alteriqipengyuania lutimaris TaxID=1538146 RepID=A0A395LNL1_9SPHN|nr:hypothetical protein [Alteriqipengyuania lutimaris]MBB3032646.1 hypothetical protein [Alteriqipengyuania lutimaris]RDS78239.1 hypothetical protein DL238_11900 [Alteriqipengyuania lutimaris]
MDREADVGGILSQTLDVASGAARAVAVYVLLLGLFNGIGGLFGLASLEDDMFSLGFDYDFLVGETYGLLGALFEFAGLLLFVIATYFLLAQMMAAVGRPMRRGARFWSFVGMSILAMIGVMIGFVLFIIPAVILTVRWAAANGFVLNGEHSVTEALGASWEATDGHGLSIFGAGLVLWIALAVLSSIVVGVAVGIGFTGANESFSPLLAVAMAISGFVEAFGNALSFAFSIAVFHLVAPSDTGVADVFE